MRLRQLAAATLTAILLTCPAFAETSLPRMQAAEPVFPKHAIQTRASICNASADYGVTVAQTAQLTLIDPLLTIAEDIARLFRPFFTNAAAPDNSSRYRTLASGKLKPQSPSKIVKIAARKRICG